MTIYFCAMCSFETDDEAESYEHDCMKPTESPDSDCPCGYRAGTRPTQIGCGAKNCPHVHTVADAKTWWAECFPQHTKDNHG